MCLRFGIPHPDYLWAPEGPLDARQWDDWRTLAAIEPLGDDRFDLLFARLGAEIFASQGEKTQLKDHLIDWYAGKQTPEEIEAAIRGYMGPRPKK